MKSILFKFRPLLIICILLAVWVYTPLGKISMVFISIKSIKIYYTIIFFIALFIGLMVMQKRIFLNKWFVVSVMAILAGYLLSVVSLILATLLMQDGIERLSHIIHSYGLIQFLSVQITFSGMLGGWLISLLATWGLKGFFNPVPPTFP